MKQEAQKISKKKVTAVVKRMKNGKNAGPDGTILEVWRCLREMTVDFLARFLNTIL